MAHVECHHCYYQDTPKGEFLPKRKPKEDRTSEERREGKGTGDIV